MKSGIDMHSEFEFGHLAGMLDIQVYDDKITIDRVDENFYKLKFVGKYTKASFTLSGIPQYFIDFKAKYTKHQLLDNLVFTNFNNSESSNLELIGKTEGLKKSSQVQVKENERGIRKANIGKVVIDLYDGTITID